MKDIFAGTYDEDLAFALYEAYEDGDDSLLDELLYQLCPLIRKVFSFDIKGSKALSDRESLEANALEEVYRVVSGKGIPLTHTKVFSRYLFTIIKRSFLDSIQETDKQVFDFWKAGKISAPIGSPEVSHYDVERALYRDQLRADTRRGVLERVRFINREKLACEFIIDSLLGYQLLEPKLAKRIFTLTSQRCNYLIRYVTILIKAIFFEQQRFERKDGALSSKWEAGGGILRAVSELRSIHIPSGII